MKTMKNLKMSLEVLQILNPLYQYYLFIKDQLQVHKSQEKSARSQDYGRTVFYTDLSVLTDGEH